MPSPFQLSKLVTVETAAQFAADSGAMSGNCKGSVPSFRDARGWAARQQYRRCPTRSADSTRPDYRPIYFFSYTSTSTSAFQEGYEYRGS